MPRIQIKESFTHKLLMGLAIGGIVILAASNPYFGIKAIGALQKEIKRRKWREVSQRLSLLRRRGLADVNQNPDGSYTVELTEAGRNYTVKYELDKLVIKHPKKWDGIWRVCIFDIPANNGKARGSLLSKLKELGFVMLQKSIWAHPFPCRNELAIMVKAFEIEPYVKFHEASNLSHEELLRKDFEKYNGFNLSGGSIRL